MEEELDVNCKVGELVRWKNISGEYYIGTLKSWDSNVAIVDVNGKEIPVEC